MIFIYPSLCSTACPVGWGRVGGRCYKWFDTFLNRDDASAFCENLGASLPITSTQAQLDYVKKIVDNEKYVTWYG